MDKKLFLSGAEELKFNISDDILNKFSVYSAMLKEWNEKMNLTAVTDDEGIAVKHFLDSVLPISVIDMKEVGSFVDIGTGAGFPGLPIKILCPEARATLIDSLNKRINFLNAVKEKLELDKIECIHGRAEELGKKSEYRERYDACFSRAVANLTVLSEYCLPFVSVGGVFVALKAEGAEEEINSAKPMIGVLGGKVEEIASVKLPKSDITRLIVKIRKIKETPKQYPRRADKIKKSAQR